MKLEAQCAVCKHPESEHGQERQFLQPTDSMREFCCLCDGYEEQGYPNGKAWHRFKLLVKP